ncbi:MAG TPA: hypothetical protein VGK25_04580 [Ignavibacteria bacterium]|jgi:hypothetical protein
MIKNDKELIRETKKYFGKDRRLLKSTLKSLKFDGKEYRYLKKFFSKFNAKKIALSNGLFQDVSAHLINKEYRKINWNWIGDLSWDVEIILNKEVSAHLDFDKKLAKICKDNTIRHLNIYISDIIPAFAVCTYFMHYKDNIYEFGPLKLTKSEVEYINLIKNEFKKVGYYYVGKRTALKKFKDLKSDLNNEGNASVFDCLFNDLDNYMDTYVKFNDKDLRNSDGTKSSWKEFYNSKRRLIKKEHYRWFESKDFEQVTTDKDGKIVLIEVRPNKNKPRYIKFYIDKIKRKNRNKYLVYY